MAKKFEYMSTHEWLGDPTTHFMKTGQNFRSPDNAAQEAMAKLIPRYINGVKVEYDISFDIPGPIKGYKLTDLLTKAVYISPNNNDIARKSLTSVIAAGPADRGRKIVEQLRTNLTDKYLQHEDDDEFSHVKELIVLPGTNILVREGTVDFEKIDQLIKNPGTYVKMHPVTSKVWKTMLKNRFGSKLIPADAPLYPIIRGADKIWFTLSSETGLSSVLLGKKIGLIAGTAKRATNFEFMYNALDSVKGMPMIDKVTAMFSYPESGFFTIYNDDIEADIAAYEQYMSQYPHG